MAREDEVENEQEVAQPTEADATEASVEEEYVEDVGDDVDDGKVGLTLLYTFFFVVKLVYLLPVFRVVRKAAKKIFCLP